jgi:hypothetical protein
MFLWGIYGQIWAVLWAVSDYKQLNILNSISVNASGLSDSASLMRRWRGKKFTGISSEFLT